MSHPLETLQIETTQTVCNGDKDIPHPRVFLTVNKQGFVDCPYCGKHFVLKADAPIRDPH